MDRYYTSIDTVKYLNRKGFEVLGTVMKNRARLTEDMSYQIDNLAKGDSLFYCSQDKTLLLTIWRDSKVAYLLSNNGDNTTGETLRHYKHTDSNITYQRKVVECPNTIKEYSQSARGVDYLDQMASYYSTDIRSNKWYMSIVQGSE